jgi:hypothetical protein
MRYLPLSCLLLLAACSDGQNARDILGFDRNAPDEFKVVSRPPLSVPPDFALRPPEEGLDDNTGLPAADSTARAAILGEDAAELIGSKKTMGEAETAVGIVQSYDLESQADGTFLDNIGAEKADSGIRKKLDAETIAKTQQQEEKSDDILGWLKSEPDVDALPIDADKEQERIIKNKASGKKLNEGEVPVEDIAPKRLIESIF